MDNAKQDKFDILVPYLLAESYYWVVVKNKNSKGQVINESICFQPNRDQLLSLSFNSAGFITLSHGNFVKVLDFLLEYNTKIDFLVKQAENLTKKAKILTQNT